MVKKKKLKGIGGWLIVVLIVFILSAISDGINAIFLLRPVVLNGYFSSLFMGLLYAIFTFLFIFSCVLMFKKKKKSKKIAIFSLWFCFITFIIVIIVWNWNNLFVFTLDYLIAILNGIVSLILTKYFLSSKRVKNTFVK